MDIEYQIVSKRIQVFEDKINWKSLSENQSITFQYVLDYPDKPWDWFELSCNKNITFQNVLDYPDKPWDWSGLSYNKNITFQNILYHLEKPWDWLALSSNTNITFQNVLDHPDKPWNSLYICKNNHIFKVDEAEIIEFAKRILKINKIKRQWFDTITNPEYLLCKKRLLKEFDLLN